MLVSFGTARSRSVVTRLLKKSALGHALVEDEFCRSARQSTHSVDREAAGTEELDAGS
jgi:hypothetical protein